MSDESASTPDEKKQVEAPRPRVSTRYLTTRPEPSEKLPGIVARDTQDDPFNGGDNPRALLGIECPVVLQLRGARVGQRLLADVKPTLTALGPIQYLPPLDMVQQQLRQAA